MARRPRAAAQAAAASLKMPIPAPDDDEEMADAPGSDAPTPAADPDEGQEDGEDAEEEPEEGDDPGTPAQDSDGPSRSMTPRGQGRPTIPRKRRLGRPPRNRPADWDADDGEEGRSDTATPRRRGRGRGGGRWGGKQRGGPSHSTQVPIDKEGNMMDVIDDEVNLPEDPEGETKVDKLGHLQNDREYRVRTFTILGRGKRLYMLSTEPARCIGFRDSYLFFQKHRLLYKIIIDEDEKRDLIDRELIPHSYKGRAIGVVTARSVFREFGARIIIGGKNIVDDYGVAAARASGLPEGELAVPDDRLPGPGEPYNRNQYVAWHGASAVYHTGAPSVPLVSGKPMEGKKRRVAVTGDNWMLEHAREASRFNSILTFTRRENNEGVYDIHTNSMQYPGIMQPTHARWEIVEDDDDDETVNCETFNGNAVEDVDARSTSKVFPKLSSFYPRNFMIHDVYLESAPESEIAMQNEYDFDETKGLHTIADDIVDELPAECRAAFEAARTAQMDFRGKWSSEVQDGQRATFLPTTVWFP